MRIWQNVNLFDKLDMMSKSGGCNVKEQKVILKSNFLTLKTSKIILKKLKKFDNFFEQIVNFASAIFYTQLKIFKNNLVPIFFLKVFAQQLLLQQL